MCSVLFGPHTFKPHQEQLTPGVSRSPSFVYLSSFFSFFLECGFYFPLINKLVTVKLTVYCLFENICSGITMLYCRGLSLMHLSSFRLDLHSAWFSIELNVKLFSFFQQMSTCDSNDQHQLGHFSPSMFPALLMSANWNHFDPEWSWHGLYETVRGEQSMSHREMQLLRTVSKKSISVVC